MLFRLVSLLALCSLVACGGRTDGEAPAFLSALGESCTKTADCVSGGRCVKQTCVPGGPQKGAVKEESILVGLLKDMKLAPGEPDEARVAAEKQLMLQKLQEQAKLAQAEAEVKVPAEPAKAEAEALVEEKAEEVVHETPPEDEGKFGDPDEPSEDKKSALKKKIGPKKVRLNDLLSTSKLEGVGAIQNIMNSNTEGLSNKMAVAMSGAGTEFVMGHGSGGLGFKGVGGTGGGGVGGYGRIHGMGQIDTGGGMGVSLGKKRMRRVGKMRFRAMNATGFCKKSGIKSKVRRRAAAIRACYEKRLMVKPRLSGKVNVKFMIGLDGRVITASTSGSLSDGSVKNCIARVIRRIRFAKPEGGICVVRWPFVFTSR